MQFFEYPDDCRLCYSDLFPFLLEEDKMPPDSLIAFTIALVSIVTIFVYWLVRKLSGHAINKDKQKADAAREDKQMEYDHTEQTQTIANLEASNQRKDALNSQQSLQAHELATQGQNHMFDILKETFGKVKDVDLNQAVYSAYILQNLQTGTPIDNAVLGAVAAKVPSPAAIELDQIVENVMLKYDREENEETVE